MYKALNGGVIGVSTGNLDNAIHLAKAYGFAGLEFNASEVAALIEAHGTAYVTDMFEASAILPAGWGLPVNWRGSEDQWRSDLHDLPRLAKAAASIGGLRTATWIMPCSNDRDWDENMEFHIERFVPIAHILEHNGVRLGLEFIGPKTLRESQKYPFVHTAAQMLQMGHLIGTNVGLLLDSWHWHTSHGTLADLQKLSNADIVTVHVNDAPAGVSIDEQVDSVRALPGATGVIDIDTFLKALQAMGYDGPIIAEPFSKELKDMPSDTARLEAVSSAMDSILAHMS